MENWEVRTEKLTTMQALEVLHMDYRDDEMWHALEALERERAVHQRPEREKVHAAARAYLIQRANGTDVSVPQLADEYGVRPEQITNRVNYLRLRHRQTTAVSADSTAS